MWVSQHTVFNRLGVTLITFTIHSDGVDTSADNAPSYPLPSAKASGPYRSLLTLSPDFLLLIRTHRPQHPEEVQMDRRNLHAYTEGPCREAL